MKRLPLLFFILFFTTWLPAQQGPSRGGPISRVEFSVQRVYTTVGGRLEPKLRIVHKTVQSGLVDEIFVSQGDLVVQDQPLFSVVQNDPGNRYLPVVVESRLDGIVSELLIGEFDEVIQATAAVVVLDINELTLEAVASDLDAFSIQTGVQITGSSPDGQVFDGVLTHVSAEPDYQTGLFTLTFTFPSRTGARVGMPLFIELPVEEVRGIFVEPDAVVRRYGKSRIWIISDEKTLSSREVETGQIVGNRLLIRSGLVAGESYLNKPTGKERDEMPLSELLGDRGGNGAGG